MKHRQTKRARAMRKRAKENRLAIGDINSCWQRDDKFGASSGLTSLQKRAPHLFTKVNGNWD